MTQIEQLIQDTNILFAANKETLPQDDPIAKKKKISAKIQGEYQSSLYLPTSIAKQQPKPVKAKAEISKTAQEPASSVEKIIKEIPQADIKEKTSNALVIQKQKKLDYSSSGSLIRLKESRKVPKPKWHAPWKLMRVISGHIGPVRAVTVDVSNEWFATGAGDRIIKIWDVASGTLKLSLTGHVATVRGLAVSPKHPYLFSCGEDHMVKCWDLEQNKVVRHYHGHTSGVYSVSLHPTLDLIVTTGRDATARVWDMRTKTQVHALTGHKSTVFQAFCQEADPQIVTCSADATIRLYDLAAGKTFTTLTHHKKSVRAIVPNPNEFTFASASPDNIKQWKCPQGQFIQNLSGHNSIINTLAMNQDNVLFSGGDNGSMYFWDYKSGYNFQTAQTVPQPGSLESEAGIYCSTFDKTGTRLITGEADKSIKIWKEDENATPETHPINWTPPLFTSVV